MELLKKIYMLVLGTMSSISPTMGINNRIDFENTLKNRIIVDMNFDKNFFNNINKEEVFKNDCNNLKKGIHNESLYLKNTYVRIPLDSNLDKYTVTFLFNWGGTKDEFVLLNIDDNKKIVFKNGTLGVDFGDNYIAKTPGKIESKKTYFVTVSVDKKNKLNNQIYINGIKQNLLSKKEYKVNMKNDEMFSIGSKYNYIDDNSMIDDLKIFNIQLNEKYIKDLYDYIRIPNFSLKETNNGVLINWESYINNFKDKTIQNVDNDLFFQNRNFLRLQSFDNPIINIFRNNRLIYKGYNTKFEDKLAQDKSKPTMPKNFKFDIEKNSITFEKSVNIGTVYNYKIKLPNNNNVTKENKSICIKKGLKGYSYIIDQNKKTKLTNDVNLDKDTNNISLPKDMKDGEYFLHIKAIGNNNQCSDIYTMKFYYEKSKANIKHLFINKKDENNIDVNFRVFDNVGIEKAYIKAYRCGNENAFSETNRFGGNYYKEIPINEIKKKNREETSQMIKDTIDISEIGGGADYVHIEVGVINKGKQKTSTSKNFKLDHNAPNIMIKSDKNIYNPKNKDFTKQNLINVTVTDNCNSIKSVTLKKDGNIIEEKSVNLSPKILLIDSKDLTLENQLKKYNYTFDKKMINNISKEDLKQYDLIMFGDSKNEINNDTAKFLNNAYKMGKRILTIDNKCIDNIHPIKSYFEGKGFSEYYQYYDIKDINNNPMNYDNIFDYMLNKSNNCEKKTFITEVPKDTRPLICDSQGKNNINMNNSNYIDATYSQNNNNGKWIHYNIPILDDVSLRRSIDECLVGYKKIQKYNTSFSINENGDYIIEAEDFSGNMREKEFTVKNIDDNNPLINIYYPEDEEKDNNKYYQYETLRILAKDKESGIDKIQLPNGNYSRINNINYRVFKNNMYKFKISDMVGNEFERRIFIKNIDNIAPKIFVKSNGKENDWVNKDVVMTMSGSDNIDNNFKLEYKINNNYWQTYNAPIVLSEDGSYKISFRGIDSAKNISNIIEQSYNIDKESPKNNDISISIEENH